MIAPLAVAFGAVLGANARYWIGLWISRHATVAFPIGTLAINLTGSFLIGLVHSALGERMGIDGTAALLVTTGFLGAYTTFSTFSFETITLTREREDNAASLYVAISVVGGVALATVGYWLGGAIA